jgi:multicomponent Na+:H+ antiporter subunit E
MKQVKSGVMLFIILFSLWLLLAGTDADELIFGSITAVVLAILFAPKVSTLGCIQMKPKSILYAFLYLFVFFGELIKSTLDVARRVLSPKLPINPGIVKVKTKLKCSLGRIVLANSITLTPGTMTVETRGEYFYIHWIDIQSDDIQATTEAIVSTFEKYLEVIFE